MGDADKVQFNGIRSVFGIDCNYTFLMCFYHVMAKVRKALKERTCGLSGELIAEVYSGIYDLHFSASKQEFVMRKEQMLFMWNTHTELDTFRVYMVKQWLESNFRHWQCYLTPTGFATTNNPCETFNRAFKRDYTQRRKLKIAVLLQQILDCCSHRSMAKLEFNIKPRNSRRLLARVTALRKSGHLREHVFAWDTISFLIDDTSTSIVRVLSVLPQRFYVPARNRSEEAIEVAAQFGINDARMEIEGQPTTGWPVDVVAGYCPCRYHAKFKSCTHLAFALQLRSSFDSNGKRLLVNRSRKHRRGSDGSEQPAVGRPRNAGHALHVE